MEGIDRSISKFKDSLVYRLSSRMARATQENPLSKNPNNNNNNRAQAISRFYMVADNPLSPKL